MRDELGGQQAVAWDTPCSARREEMNATLTGPSLLVFATDQATLRDVFAV